jgi:hypothetical protein
MSAKSREILMGIIAAIMLLIYVYTLGKIILAVASWDPKTGPYVTDVNLIWLINIAGGVVSGVVIGNLGAAEPGKTPLCQVRTLAVENGKTLMQYIVWIYIIIWLIIGSGALYVGLIKCPDVSPQLTEIGKSWVGMLAAALFAWFGIKPS